MFACFVNVLSNGVFLLVLKHSKLLLCRHCDLLLFSIVTGDRLSWQLVFQHRLSLSAAIWDIAFLTERHLLVLQATANPTAVVCTLSVSDSSSVTVLVVLIQSFL